MGKIFFKEDDDILDIRKDGVFKAVFAKDTPESLAILSKLVSAFIGVEISIISILTNEPTIENIHDIQFRLDINCRAADGELINVEMSLNPKPLETRRMEFHAARLLTGQDIRGIKKGYGALKKVYQITILANESFFQDDKYYHEFKYYDHINKTSLNGMCTIISIELTKLRTILEKPVEEMSHSEKWAVYLEYLTDRSKRNIINEILETEEGIAMANEAVYKVSQDEIERARIMRAEKTELDYISYMAYAEETGRAEERKEIAKNAFSEGASIGFVKKITGLDDITLKEIQSKLTVL